MNRLVENTLKLLIVKTYEAPKTLVFEVLTNDKHIQRWHAPPNMEVIKASCDFREGGSYSIRIGSNKQTYDLEGQYQRIQPPKRISYTQKAPNSTFDTLIDIELEEINGITTMRFKHSGFVTQRDRENSLMGWNSALDQVPHILREMLDAKKDGKKGKGS